MKSLKKLMSVFILGVPFALLPAGCAMGVDGGDLDDSASVEASETQAADLEVLTADSPELETTQGFGRGCRDRCWRAYKRCQVGPLDRFDRSDRFDHGGRRGDRCWWRYQRCLRNCFRPPPLDRGGPDRGGPDH